MMKPGSTKLIATMIAAIVFEHGLRGYGHERRDPPAVRLMSRLAGQPPRHTSPERRAGRAPQGRHGRAHESGIEIDPDRRRRSEVAQRRGRQGRRQPKRTDPTRGASSAQGSRSRQPSQARNGAGDRQGVKVQADTAAPSLLGQAAADGRIPSPTRNVEERSLALLRIDLVAELSHQVGTTLAQGPLDRDGRGTLTVALGELLAVAFHDAAPAASALDRAA